MSEKRVKICGRCGSTNITPYTGTGMSFGESLQDHCKDCSLVVDAKSTFIIEIPESEVEGFRKNIKRKK